MTTQKLYEKLVPSEEKLYKYAYLTKNGLEVNLVDMYSAFICDAARCNAYNSDVVYDICSIKDAMECFDPETEFTPIWVGFRKMGVDGTSFVLCKAEENNLYESLSKNYFALYSINVKPEADNYYTIVLRKYAV